MQICEVSVPCAPFWGRLRFTRGSVCAVLTVVIRQYTVLGTGSAHPRHAGCRVQRDQKVNIYRRGACFISNCGRMPSSECFFFFFSKRNHRIASRCTICSLAMDTNVVHTAQTFFWEGC